MYTATASGIKSMSTSITFGITAVDIGNQMLLNVYMFLYLHVVYLSLKIPEQVDSFYFR